jgi:Zn-dependent M28 family amino/carboxypeptidase
MNNADNLKRWVSDIASDNFQGRFPATVGEEKTINYLAEQFLLMGVKPGNEFSFFQEIPLIQNTADQTMKLKVHRAQKEVTFNFLQDFIGGTPLPVEQINISNADLVFVGYGINAPEFDWNDYKGVDVKGKIVIALVNDPGFYDSTLFQGKNMTYYGRWIYKYEEAAKQGALGVILVHETDAASYPWSVVQNSWSGSRFYLANNIVTQAGMKFQSWITTEGAKKIFSLASLDYDKEIKGASKCGFRPASLGLKVSINFKNKTRQAKSNNIVAIIPGTDLDNEYIIYTAHWDHFGINPKFKGDSILNGALDNATGTAALLDVANAFMEQEVKPRRSIIFMATTCEEQGLLGSQYYAENPIYPLNKTVAVINMDALNIFGKTKDMSISGYGFSELDDYATEVLKTHNRYASFQRNQSGGGYYRSDHFSFSKVGVPTMNLNSGSEILEKDKVKAIEIIRDSIYKNYHKPSDNYNPDLWSFDGMVEDLTIYFELGYKLSMTDEYPNWREGVIYKAKRDEMMKR